MSGDELAELERDYPGWHAWTGVSGLFYARLPKSSPPVVYRAATVGELRQQVLGHIAAKTRP